MRNLAFMLSMATLLPITVARPFVGVLLWSWVSFMSPHQSVWGIASDLPWAMLIFWATLLGCVVAREPKRFPFNGTTVLIILFMVCITLTSLFALAPAVSVETKWEATFKTFLFLLVTAALLTDRVRIHALLWVMVISLGYYGVRGGGFTLLTGGAYRVWGPPNSMISDNNHIAAALLVALPLMNYLRMHSRHRVVRIGFIVAMTLTLFAVLGSYSRGALLGLSAMASFLWWNSRRKLVSGAVLAVVLAGAIAFMPAHWADRMSTIETYQKDSSAESRLAIWQVALTMALERPATGAGFMGPYTLSVVNDFVPGAEARAVHSIYFEVLGEHGFPTFFVWLGITLAGIVSSIRIIRDTRHVPALAWCHDLAKMAQVSIIAYLVAGAFLSLSYWDFYFTIIVAITATRVLVVQALSQGTKDKPIASAWRNRPAPARAAAAILR